MTNATDALRDALYNLHELTQCRCHDDYKSRGRIDPDCNHDYREDVDALQAEVARLRGLLALAAEGEIAAQQLALEKESAEAALAEARKDAARLDYIERTFSGMTNRERYLPVQMIWGKGCNGRTLREACDKYMKRDAAMGSANGQG